MATQVVMINEIIRQFLFLNMWSVSLHCVKVSSRQTHASFGGIGLRWKKTNKLFIKGVSFAFYILIIFTALPLRHWNIYALTRHLLRRLVASTTYFRATHSDFVIIIGLWHRAKAAFCTMYSTLVYCSLVVLLLFQYVF